MDSSSWDGCTLYSQPIRLPFSLCTQPPLLLSSSAMSWESVFSLLRWCLFILQITSSGKPFTISLCRPTAPLSLHHTCLPLTRISAVLWVPSFSSGPYAPWTPGPRGVLPLPPPQHQPGERHSLLINEWVNQCSILWVCFEVLDGVGCVAVCDVGVKLVLYYERLHGWPSHSPGRKCVSE